MPAESQMQSPAVAAYSGLTELEQKIAELDAALAAKHPLFPTMLQVIHRNLSSDPALTYLLKPEQKTVIMKGLMLRTQTQIVQEKVASAASGRNKGLKSIGIEDI